MIILMPIVYVSDMDRAVNFYASLGFAPDPKARSRMWTQLNAGDRAILALHRNHEGSEDHLKVEVALVATEPLERVATTLRAQGIDCSPIVDEAYGRSMMIRDPDGMKIQVNEHEH